MLNHTEAARQMVDRQLCSRGIRDAAVLAAMRQVPRHRFAPGKSMAEAYADHALPTSEGQTISQPYIVARMTELLAVRPGLRVLEIGTGSGYQTAILLKLGAEVVSIERYPSLAEQAQAILGQLMPGSAVQIIVGDGTRGYQAAAPYDRILVTAGAPHLPQAYRRQLANTGRIVIPIGDRHSQDLTLIRRHGVRRHRDVPCRFVPLIGKDGWCSG